MRNDNRLSLEGREPEVKLGQKRDGRGAHSEGVRALLTIAQEMLAALSAHRLVCGAIAREEDNALRFRIPGTERSFIVRFRKLLPVAIGKAAPWMGQAFSRITGGRWAGIGVCSKGTACSSSDWTWLHGDHPTPGVRSIHAGGIIARRISTATSEDLVVLLLSGGASSLAMAPKQGVSATVLASLIQELLYAGTSIHQLNAVRRRLDLLKGGGFARLAAPAHVVSLILSDVPGNRLSDIGSGPTAGPCTDEPNPWNVVVGADLVSLATPRVEQLLKASKSTWPFPRPMNLLIGSNEKALHAAAQAARRLGYVPVVHPKNLMGEARTMGRSLAVFAKQMIPVNQKTCLLFGGETVVRVRGRGEGGRNLELALSFALESSFTPGISMMTLGTDGKDGSSPAAGAAITTGTFGDDPYFRPGAEKALEANDSYTYLANVDAALYTGPTGTNVADVVCILLEPQ